MNDDPGSTEPSASGDDHRQPAGEPVAARPQGSVEVFVADEQDALPVDTDRWLRLVVQVLAEEGVEGGVEMSLLFVDEATISALNEKFMGKTGPTDVLSFPIDEEATPAGRHPDNGRRGPGDDDEFDEDEQPLMLGDVLICPAVAARNALEHLGAHHDGTTEDELALLVVHGILHLMGMDHEDEEEAEAMEERERQLLHKFHRPILTAPAPEGDFG
jgi:probable rRNA maturation factor